MLLFINTFIYIFLIDNVLTYLFSDIARWFQLHFVINMISVYLTYQNVTKMIMYPLSSFDNYDNNVVISYTGILHVYHNIFFKMKIIDYYHHILSVYIPFLIIYNINRRITSLYFFIFCGLPGGIEYLMLSLVKHNKIESLTQKHYSSLLNTYLRIPGGIIASFLSYTIANEDVNINISEKYSLYIISVILFFNCTVFGKMAIENYVQKKKCLNKK